MDTLSIHQRIAMARRQLGDAGIESDEAALDARVLAEHVLGWNATRLFADGHERASADFLDRYDAAVVRRVAREPVAYITGTKEFWGLTIQVSPAVLIPRPETEGIVEHALSRLPDRTRAWQIADVCTGSGCLAVALAREYSHAHVVATDISEDAVAIARRNVERHRMNGRVALIQADLLSHAPGPFDLIVANPPYVTNGARVDLQPEVAFEPAIALFAGDDGLEVIRRLLAQSAPRLTVNGLLMFEFGFGQDRAVSQLISAQDDLTMVAIEPDISGIPRIAIAARVTR
jgi:release factor glutamine methyltransferase